MSNKVFLYDYERGHFKEAEMCSIWPKNCILYNSCRYSFVIASVVFNIDRVTTQHTPKCVENYSDNNVSYNYPSNSYQIFCKLGYNSENSVFFFNRRLIILFWNAVFHVHRP